MKVDEIEKHMDNYERAIAVCVSIIDEATNILGQKTEEYREFKRDYPHPNNKGGSGPYGAWTFEDTLEEVRYVRERNNNDH